jgi:cell division GTPase FtsZ
MNDKLVKRLREHAQVAHMAAAWGFAEEGMAMQKAADLIEELEDKLNWVIVERDETFALMLDRAQTAEAKLAKAVEALEEAIYLLDPEEEDIAKETGIYRVVTTYRELKEKTND